MASCHSSLTLLLFCSCTMFAQLFTDGDKALDERLHLPQLETSIGGKMDIEEFAGRFPQIIRLSREQKTITLPADPKVGLMEPATIQFIEIINAGRYGAVMRANMNGVEEIAFKIFRPRSSGPSMFQERQETMTMKYLSTYMDEVVKPKCGTKVHFFKVDGVEFRGIGMELFPFPTLADYFQGQTPGCTTSMGAFGICVGSMFLSSDRHFNPNSEAMRIQLLNSAAVRKLYQDIVDILCKFWKLGVVHQDLHANNILYDGNTGVAKVIDWGMAERPVATQYLKFIFAVCADLYRFTYTFAFAVIYPREYHSLYEKLTHSEEYVLSNAILKLSDDVRAMIGVGAVPTTPKMRAVWIAFRELHGMKTPYTWPKNKQLMRYLNGEFKIDWERNDDDSKVGSVPKVAPPAPSPLVTSEGAKAPSSPNAKVEESRVDPKIQPPPSTPEKTPSRIDELSVSLQRDDVGAEVPKNHQIFAIAIHSIFFKRLCFLALFGLVSVTCCYQYRSSRSWGNNDLNSYLLHFEEI